MAATSGPMSRLVTRGRELRPGPPLNSDPACMPFVLSASSFLAIPLFPGSCFHDLQRWLSLCKGACPSGWKTAPSS